MSVTAELQDAFLTLQTRLLKADVDQQNNVEPNDNGLLQIERQRIGAYLDFMLTVGRLYNKIAMLEKTEILYTNKFVNDFNTY